MTLPQLITGSGSANIDRVLQALIGIFETAFPNRIRGYFVEGSYADQSAVTTSDVDLVILFKGTHDKQEQHKAKQLAAFYNMAVRLELDIELLDENIIAKGVAPSLKLASSRIYGEAIGDHFPLISLAEWGRERIHAAYWLMIKVFGRGNRVSQPLDFPRPDKDYYGYVERTVCLANGRQVKSTRDLIRVIGWAGTALIALKARQFVTRKKDCHILYRKHIADEWTTLFESIYTKCRQEWQYLIPENRVGQEELKEICQRSLQFENYFLTVYKSYLLTELRGQDKSAIEHALRVQEAIPFIDQEISTEIRRLTTAESAQIRAAALNIIKSHY